MSSELVNAIDALATGGWDSIVSFIQSILGIFQGLVK